MMFRDTWIALGMSCEVLSDGLDAEDHERLLELAHRRIAEADAAYSRFRDDSELVALGHQQWTAVSPTLYDAVSAAIDAARLTDGLVTPTLGRHLRVLGYDTDFAVVRRREVTVLPGAPHLAKDLPRRDGGGELRWQGVELAPASRRLRLPEHLDLDLGAIGKAYLVDQIANEAQRTILRRHRGSVLVNLGGDIAVRPSPDLARSARRRWRIGIDDLDPGVGAAVWLADGGIATSSTRLRTWHQGGIRRHHVLDPRTGLPAVTPWGWATVLAGSATAANSGATAAIVLGDVAPAWLAARGLAARLVGTDGALITTPGWPTDDDLTLLDLTRHDRQVRRRRLVA